MNPVYLEFRDATNLPLGARIPSVAVPDVGELVSVRGTLYRTTARSWLYDGDDEDTCYCIVQLAAAPYGVVEVAPESRKVKA